MSVNSRMTSPPGFVSSTIFAITSCGLSTCASTPIQRMTSNEFASSFASMKFALISRTSFVLSRGMQDWALLSILSERSRRVRCVHFSSKGSEIEPSPQPMSSTLSNCRPAVISCTVYLRRRISNCLGSRYFFGFPKSNLTLSTFVVTWYVSWKGRTYFYEVWRKMEVEPWRIQRNSLPPNALAPE
jgi:hypothetical protein